MAPTKPHKIRLLTRLYESLISHPYEFLRNQVLDARNFFAPPDQPDPRNQRNQFGFSLGGPIFKDRTFFFGDYEGARFREGVTRLANAPTARERVGDFSQMTASASRRD